jgi:hypothetical protein
MPQRDLESSLKHSANSMPLIPKKRVVRLPTIFSQLFAAGSNALSCKTSNQHHGDAPICGRGVNWLALFTFLP